MLRTGLLIVAGLVLLIAFAALITGHPEAQAPAIWGGLLFLAVLVERWRYKARHGPLSADWVKTDERFVDPESGHLTQVFYNPKSGERRYEAVRD
jgi:hypothetical protein